MTSVQDQAARAADLDAAHVVWSGLSWRDRPTFGAYAIEYLRRRNLEVLPTPQPAPATAAEGIAALLHSMCPHLAASPFVDQALTMSVEQIADLLAALAERGLHWQPGADGRCGTLTDGTPPEPPDLHVVFDTFRAAWQRDDQRAEENESAPFRACWYGPNGAVQTWSALSARLGPLTPDGGIAPPARDAGDDGCEGGPR
jgi:hypothetical protein